MNSICYIAADTNLAVAGIVLLIACIVMYHIYQDAIWQTRMAMILIIVAQLINLTLTLIIIYRGLKQLSFAIACGACITIYFLANEYV